MYFYPSGLLPARYILAILGSVGMAIVYGLKVNLSVAMVIMVNSTALQIEKYENEIVSHRCNASLTDLPMVPPPPNGTTPHINVTAILEQNKKLCNEITEKLTNLTTKEFTEAELNEVNMPELIGIEFETD